MSVTEAEAPARTVPDVPVKGIAPYLCVENADAAGAFYQRAFGAEEVNRVGEAGKLMHLHLYINNGSLMLSDPFPEHGCPYAPAQGFNLQLQVDDIDAWWDRAVAAGAEVVMPVQRMFWGDRYGQLKDPFGVTWGMGSSK